MGSSNLTPVELDCILTDYFKSWRPYHLIVVRLKEVHGLNRSVSWLKVQYNRLGLFRRPIQYSPLSLVHNCIRKELRSSNCLLGYRQLWKRLRDNYGLFVKRDTVMNLLRQMDPEGVMTRQRHRLTRRVYFSKGPNFIWHIDGYDKLSTYRFCIHGCIDGFSRRLLWLRVGSSNHDPNVVLQYYLDCIEEVHGCPCVIRMDKGTENVQVAATQYALRADHDDSFSGELSFRFGSSPANIRIESFWSHLRRHKTGWWIKALKMLEQEGLYNSANVIHQKCLHTVFFSLIERELDQFKCHWNSHKIRASRNGDCLGGIPNDLYDMPSYYGTTDYLKPLDTTVISISRNDAHLSHSIVDDEFYMDCMAVIEESYGANFDLHRDITIDNSLDVYVTLIETLSE